MSGIEHPGLVALVVDVVLTMNIYTKDKEKGARVNALLTFCILLCLDSCPNNLSQIFDINDSPHHIIVIPEKPIIPLTVNGEDVKERFICR